MRDAILGVSNTATHTAAISRLNYQLGELYAKAVARTVRRYGAIELIGCHGQTIFHEGRSNTLQLGEPAVLAERTGVPVVSNFRARDIAAGGQGAPLVPYVDYLLFRHPRRTRVALNIGGIANITLLPASAGPEDVIAFDTGPGNMVIDALAGEFTRGKMTYDRGGRIAASGSVDRTLLQDLLRDPYYRRKPPKSAGREQYGAEFVVRLKARKLPLRDLVATATVFTAATIAHGVRSLTPEPAELIASGGGVHNPAIMRSSQRLFAGSGRCHLDRVRRGRRCQGSRCVCGAGSRNLARTPLQSAGCNRRAPRGRAGQYYAGRRSTTGCPAGRAVTGSPTCIVFQSYANSLPQSRQAT